MVFLARLWRQWRAGCALKCCYLHDFLEQSAGLDHLEGAGAPAPSDLFCSLAHKVRFQSLFLSGIWGLQDACDAGTLFVTCTGLILGRARALLCAHSRLGSDHVSRVSSATFQQQTSLPCEAPVRPVMLLRDDRISSEAARLITPRCISAVWSDSADRLAYFQSSTSCVLLRLHVYYWNVLILIYSHKDAESEATVCSYAIKEKKKAGFKNSQP